jgi:aspartyl-tRNA(Asn)/glutamyl-tRNA(Gln) amidotransferase subunit B
VKPAGSTKLGTRVEVKNMNSFRAVKDAINFEVSRQIELVESGGAVVQETRLWNEAQGATFSMRSKEEAHDYRYFPEPDLLTVRLDDAFIESLRASLPELADQRRARFTGELGLSDYDADVLASERALADFFDTALKALPEPGRKAGAKPVVNWITTELLGRLNADKRTISDSPVTPAGIAELVALIQAGTLSGKLAKEVFGEAYASGGSPKDIVAKKGLTQVTDEGELLKFVDEVIAENPKIVADVKGGKEAAVGSLVGRLMQKTKGRANPQLANALFKKRIG